MSEHRDLQCYFENKSVTKWEKFKLHFLVLWWCPLPVFLFMPTEKFCAHTVSGDFILLFYHWLTVTQTNGQNHKSDSFLANVTFLSANMDRPCVAPQLFNKLTNTEWGKKCSAKARLDSSLASHTLNTLKHHMQKLTWVSLDAKWCGPYPSAPLLTKCCWCYAWMFFIFILF